MARHKFSRLTDDMMYMICGSEELAWEYFVYERWNGRSPSCLHCGYTDVFIPTTGRIFRCRNKRCRRKFSPTKNTVFEKSKIPMKTWFKALIAMLQNNGKSAHSFFEQNEGMHYDTTWYMVHRIRQLLQVDHETIVKKSGVHEIDEVFVGLDLTQASKSVKAKYPNGGGQSHMTPVFVCHTRKKRTYAKVMCKNVKGYQIQEVIKKITTKNSTVYSDKSTLYSKLEEHFQKMVKLNHSENQHSDGKGGHTNNLNRIATQFTAMMVCYHRLSTQYLQRYVDELMFYLNSSMKTKSIQKKLKFAMSNMHQTISRKQLKEEGRKNNEWVFSNTVLRPLEPKKGKKMKTIKLEPPQSGTKAA